MTEFSPATQAILDAYGNFEPANVDALAAALTALAVRIKGAPGIREDILDIVNELETFQ